MKNILIILIFNVNISIVIAQVNSIKDVTICGEIVGDSKDLDSIYFYSGDIEQKYFEISKYAVKISNNKFNIPAKLTYPKMFRVLFFSDRSIRVRRPGIYFIDQSTNYIKVNYVSEECNQVNGVTSEEFHNRFIPFFFEKRQLYHCDSNDIEDLLRNSSTSFDSTLLNYIIKYPDSFVALWILIERFRIFGHTEIREKTLQHFSKKIKKESIWNLLNNDLKNSPLKVNEKFLIHMLKDTALKEQKFYPPKAKLTLIDFWFSRCRPCLDGIPTLKNLYLAYKSKGFEIVSISTDKSENISIWQKRVKAYDMSWIQYLDENGIEAQKLNIHSFPTFLLLNSKGKIIKKSISLEEIGELVKENMGK